MERYEEELIDANKKYDIAFHLINKTFPTVDEPKILLASLGEIFEVFQKSMFAIMHYERHTKKIPPFNDTYEGAMIKFEQISEKLNINSELIKTMEEVKETLDQHKTASVEFRRNDAFIIADNDYRLKTIDLNKTRDYLNKSKQILDKAAEIVKK